MPSRSLYLFIAVAATALLLATGCLKQVQAGRPSDKEKAASKEHGQEKTKSKGVAMADDKGSTAEALKEVAGGINQFGLRLYREVKAEPGNLFFSPYSLATAISMVYEGAAGSTADEIQSVIKFPASGTQRQPAVAALHNSLNPQKAPYQLAVANGIWSQQDFALLPEYVAVLKDRYASEAATMDFQNHAEDSREMINKWVAQRTNDRIKDLFQEGVIRPDTRLVLANAIFFKGRWARQFDPERTFDQSFRRPAGAVNARFMIPAGEDKDYRYFEDEMLKALELPYEGDRLAMLMLLPKADDLAALDAALGAELISRVDAGLASKNVIVQIPRFTFKSKFELNETLAALGMPTAFSDDADFSGMTGGKDLKIGAAVHQAFVEVNEEGTEAAAASGIVMRPTGAAMNPITFIADHPFLFLIRDKASGAILFMGRVEDPTAQ